jgi:hypothetical protein
MASFSVTPRTWDAPMAAVRTQAVLGGRVVLIEIGMVLECQLANGGLALLLGRRARHPEDGVVVLEGCGLAQSGPNTAGARRGGEDGRFVERRFVPFSLWHLELAPTPRASSVEHPWLLWEADH